MPFLTHFGHFQGPTGNVLTEKLPVDAYTDWGFSERSDCLNRGATGPGICASKYGKAKRSPAGTK